MSRDQSDSIRANISVTHLKSTSPRTSVYDRLGPPGLHAPTIKSEDTCRYILKNGHCRFGDECTYYHTPSHALTNQDYSGEVTQFLSSTVESNILYREKSEFESTPNDCNISSNTFPERKLVEIDQIKGNIRKHISGSSNIVNIEDPLFKKVCNSRVHKQMGSVVQRGCKNLKIQSSEEHNLVNDKIKSISSSVHRNTSLDRDQSMTSDSFNSGDERDSSTDSISENETLVLGVSKVKDFGEKALSSISESSFSSVPSTDKTPSQKKKSLRNAKRTSRVCSAKVIDSVSKRDNMHGINCYNHDLKHRPATSQMVAANTAVPVHSHKFFKKHSKRIKSFSFPEDCSRYRKDHHRDKKRISKSNQAIENHLKSSDQTIRVKSDRDKRFRTQKNLIAPSISLPDDYSQISHNSSLKIKSSSKKSSENVKCCTPNESSRKGTSILDLTERITSDATSIIQPIPNSINLSKISNSDAVLKQILVPHNLFHNVEVVENISEVKTSANQFIDSSSELSIVHDKLSLNSNLKRKHNRKYCEVVGKKLRKSDDCNLPRRDTSQHKDRRSVIKNEMRSSSNLNSKSDSPLNVIKDGLEIYDSLSDIDQVTLLEEDLYSHNFVNFANGTHLLHIDWAGLNFNTSIHFQPQTIAHHSLISQVGLSYSLLGEDTFVQCVKNLFNQKPNPQILSCIRQLGFGAFIEDIIHLEKDRIEIELDCCKHYGYIKCRDIYLRRIISGYRGILNSSSDSLSGANYNSPCVTTELFNSALHIYHRSTSSTK